MANRSDLWLCGRRYHQCCLKRDRLAGEQVEARGLQWRRDTKDRRYYPRQRSLCIGGGLEIVPNSRRIYELLARPDGTIRVVDARIEGHRTRVERSWTEGVLDGVTE